MHWRDSQGEGADRTQAPIAYQSGHGKQGRHTQDAKEGGESSHYELALAQGQPDAEDKVVERGMDTVGEDSR